MIYAIVVDYTDGHSDTLFINQKAVTATKEDACLMGFTYTDTDHTKHLAFYYVSEIQKENRAHPVVTSTIDIDLSNALAVRIYNTDSLNGEIVIGSLLSVPYKS